VIPWVAWAASSTRAFDGVDLSEGTVFSAIGGWFGGVVMTLIGDIITPIARAISWAAGQLEGWIGTIWITFLSMVGSIPPLFTNIVDYVATLVGQARDFAVWLYDQTNTLIDTVSGQLTNLLDTLAGVVGDIVTTVLTDGFGFGNWLWNLVYDGMIAPLWQTFTNTLDTLWQQMVQFLNATLDGLFAAGSWVWDRVTALVNELLNVALAGIGDVIAVVRGAWNFLVWIAAHPLDWFSQQVDAVFGHGETYLIDHLEAAIESNQDRVAAWVDSVFA
jgi:hypothetical protein